MNMNLVALSHATLQDIGWTLVHFLWQGAFLAALLGVILQICRGSLARHNWALGTAVTMALAPVMTFLLIHNSRSDNSSRLTLDADAPDALWSAAALLPGVDLLVFPWLAGVLFLSVRTLGGLWVAESLRRSDVALLPSNILQRCRALQARFTLHVPVQFM